MWEMEGLTFDHFDLTMLSMTPHTVLKMWLTLGTILFDTLGSRLGLAID